jgi:TOMM system kinase/cyclase fusion protein
MGTVWRAWDERLRRQVAVKRIHTDSISHAAERLRREARAAARLNHPAIVHVYDLIEREDGDWIVMELVVGRTLRQLVAEDGPLAPQDAIRLGRELAEGLAEAHDHGILHRDLKTVNVMVTPAGRAKILDFGLAKEMRKEEEAASHELSLSTPGTVLGTCHAMSPEQAMGLDLSAASDLFSLGSLLYEALTGQPPFLAGNPHETLGRVLNFVPRPLCEVRPEIPRELSHLVGRLLEKSPLRRPHSAHEVAGCLGALGAAPPSSAAAVQEPIADESEMTIDVRPPWLGQTNRDGQTSTGSGRHWSSGERRRLTVVCCGLVQVDNVSEEVRFLDIEALSDAMEAFQKLAREVVERLGGRLGATLGGHQLWFYFGYPRANEDDPRRAVRAARTLAARAQQLGVRLGGGRQRLAVRIGIHTGRAVIETRPGKGEQLQLGATLDLAIGLQNAASAGSVVVSAASQRLLVRSFEMDALPPARLPGIAEPEPVYEVRGEIDHRDASEPQALVGRDQEVQLLIDRFRLARSGTGQAVVISGEAGIGKSSLVRALREGLATEDATWLVGYASPYTQSSPLAPIIELLERGIFSAANAPSERRISQLEGFLSRYDLPLPENAPLLASFLSVPTEGRYPPLALSPEVQRKKTLEVLVAVLAEMAERKPVVLALEDLHWIDPTTLELMDLLLEEITAVPLMLVATFRPEFQASWRHQAHVTQISLSRLTDGETDVLIGHLAEGSELPADMRRQIAARTDGVPLFVEELTKAVLETGWSDGEPEIPSTLDGSLMARLDRLGDAKEVAQLASVIGRVFSLELLAVASQLEEMALRRGLEELMQAELIYRRGVGARARYVFKHALIQDAAYLSLLTSQRQQIHERIAHALEELAPAQDIEPEILAHHFAKADLIPQAVSYLQQAARHATQRSAYREALSHCRKGIDLTAGLQPSPQTLEMELALRSAMGVALIPMQGYASQDVAENAERCQALCRELGDAPRLIPSLYGLWVYHLLRGHRQPSIEVSDEIARLSQGGAKEHVFIGFSARGITAFFQGDLQRAQDLFEQAMAIYTPALHPALAQSFGEESGLLPHFYHFWCVWLRGRPEEAIRRMHQALRIVSTLTSPYVLVTANLFEMILWHALREPEEVRRVAEKFVELSREQQFPFFLALATCGYGWTSLHRGDPEAGIAQVQEALENHRLIGTRLPRAYWLTYLIELYLAVGKLQEGLAAADEALTLSETQLDVYYDAEVRRLRGELLLRLSEPRQAEEEFHRALEIARRQGARAFELRAATSLGRLLREQGRAGEARPLLAEVYGTYREGFETLDLREARQLLDELEPS